MDTFSSSVKEILGGCSLKREAATLLFGAGGGVTQVAPASMAPLETHRQKREQLKHSLLLFLWCWLTFCYVCGWGWWWCWWLIDGGCGQGKMLEFYPCGREIRASSTSWAPINWAEFIIRPCLGEIGQQAICVLVISDAPLPNQDVNPLTWKRLWLNPYRLLSLFLQISVEARAAHGKGHFKIILSSHEFK